MRYLFGFVALLFFVQIALGDSVEITANEMIIDEEMGRVHFTGNVLTQQEKSTIKSNELLVVFDENNETKYYDAIGEVKFDLISETSHYKGECGLLRYYPQKDLYILKKNAYVDDLKSRRHISGELVEIDMKKQTTIAKSGKKKPVKVILEIGK